MVSQEEEKSVIPLPTKFSIPYLLASFLVPGAVITGLYVALQQFPVFRQLPNIVPFSLAGFIGSILTQWVHIALFMRKNKTPRLKDALGLKTILPVKQYILWVPVILLIEIAFGILVAPVASWFQARLFSWVPEWFVLNGEWFLEGYAAPAVWMAFGCIFLITSIIVPITEEIYFRGFLMPRMEWLGKAALPLNVLLFSVYHLFTPWQILTRFVSIFPLYYIVKKKDSFLLGVIAHCSLNFLFDFLIVLILYL